MSARRKLAVAGVMSAIVGGFITVRAVSATPSPCATRSTTTPFKQWGDSNKYFSLSGGDFESKGLNWNLGYGAQIVGENEPWKVLSTKHESSLQLKSGASVVTEPFCVGSDEDSIRYFVKKPGVRGSKLHVHVAVTSGVNVATNDFDVDGSAGGWAVVDRMMLPDIRDKSGQQWVTVEFGSRTGTWLVDDVLVDPWRTS